MSYVLRFNHYLVYIRSDLKGTKHEERLDLIMRNAKRLQRLTENILDVSKIESRSLDLRQVHFNLKDVITNTLNDTIVMRNSSSDKRNKKANVRLCCQLQESIVEGDEGRIGQVVYNLVNNALKFSKEGGTITINTRLEDNEVTVSIKDNGQGIDPKIFPKLFSKFEAKSFSGTGLGLFSSKSIIEAHGGRVWAENNNAVDGERGATFYFSLPVLGMQHNQSAAREHNKMYS